MLTTLLDTDRLPPADRTAAWEEATARALLTTSHRFPDPENFGARLHTVTLGPARLSDVSYTSLVSQRTPRLIRRSDPEFYQVALATVGQQGMEHAGRRTTVGAGDIMLYDSSRPFTATAGPAGSTSHCLLLQFPRSLMPLPDKVVAPLCGTTLDGARGTGLVLRQTLTGLIDAHDRLGPGDRVRLGHTAIDLAAAVIAQHAERPALLPPETRQQALFHDITRFITLRLGDPDLKPAAIAAAHFISTRYLHRVFQRNGTTVNGFVRQARISRCRRDLADPSLHATPVAAIGARWGFTRPSDFTRAFRAATGMTPGEYRAAARGS
ncbi:helix-turn-helix domain-containing protein [Streptomyces somaliensis DSM 40738]|uniref:Helix-turn-helix domain-containing protein n=1 Tax=Streptomyces somaliensis (strain ATCC 33201 / DSM 40738 / JCM 12659 / KCTC 9044 / NCTC 11332 / NRRL B-12077 / IP 733) TaxID=1134445 RepID=A0AA44DCF3_STRE0|nr:helix-turn-helix domain-containing protein [Streptomyces somaliensis]MCQ0023096.1 helix-turn-helix domain-containing protein [Streptomyces somaliensis DSM 40738]NKY13646.1 helix-turn-helix domain-containing protein [Streptomyces somaliensis DSM 40738]